MISTEYNRPSFRNVMKTQNCYISKKLIHAKPHERLNEIIHATKRSGLFISNAAVINFLYFRRLRRFRIFFVA
jgi:hypothetical protein